MLFWIFLGITVASIIFAIAITDEGIVGFMSGFICVLVFGLSLGLLTASNYTNSTVTTVSTETLTLKALANNTATTGNRGYYLGGSYLGTKRVLNYMTDTHGAVKVEAADAQTSTVFEDTEASKASVTVQHQVVHNDFLVPWNIGTQNSYAFHIPAGSVTSSYTLDNK